MQVVKLFMPFFIFFARFQNYGKHFSQRYLYLFSFTAYFADIKTVPIWATSYQYISTGINPKI